MRLLNQYSRPTRCGWVSDHDEYIKLIKAVARERGVNQRIIANAANVSPSLISRYFSKERALDHDARMRMIDALRIDRFRSFVAVELFGDFTRYFDPGFLVFCHMTKRMSDMFCVEHGDGEKHSQTPRFIQFISEQIKDISGENDDAFEDMRKTFKNTSETNDFSR